MAKKKDDVTEIEEGTIYSLKGMYKDYFLDYASYVILERAVPTVEDGLKPVQRRILHSMWEKNDGRYHKVANLIGHTMQYHPHGDAAIGDALVNLGQKDLLIDMQGNWGDIRTGDGAAASRYIEARLTKFALEIGFNPQTTEWQLSYDGRNKEPVQLPVKFPLLLVQGADGIAVGLSTKILPHNFIEVIKAAIKHLEGKKQKFYPDFLNGGIIDVADYQSGKRGGRVRVRARIEQVDKKQIIIRELPYGVTTVGMIDSIVKATDKGKIKIKKLVDNTARDVEIVVELASGVSPEVTIDALYAFTDCEISISPNACVIVDNKPRFVSVDEMLQISTDRTKELLKQELEIRKSELDEKWHFASLEKVFIENRIYHDIEECESWEEVLEAIAAGLQQYVSTPATIKKKDKRLALHREVTTEDITRLTEIRIKRISKYNVFKADELITGIEEELAQVHYDLKHLTVYAINYFESLLERYGKGRERRTEITDRPFESIQAAHVIANNAKLYVNKSDGFIGYGLKKDEFVAECSDIDDVIAIRKDGKAMVSRISEKVFMGKRIEHVAVWKKGDERTTYNMIYVDGKTGKAFAKRFNVTAITRDKEYDLTTGTDGSRMIYLSANPNGESEVVEIHLSSGSRARIKVFDFDFGQIAIKGRSSKGNVVSKYPIRKITQKEVGKSTLGAQKLWMDTASGRLNQEARGRYLGAFDTGDMILTVFKDGSYQLSEISPTLRFGADDVMWIGKYQPDQIISAVYYEGEKGWTMVKRFAIETISAGQRFKFITEHKSSKLVYATADPEPELKYGIKSGGKKQESSVVLADFIEPKGWKALGNKLTDYKIISLEELHSATTAPETAQSRDELKTERSSSKPQTTLFPDAEEQPKKKPVRNVKKKSTAKKSAKQSRKQSQTKKTTKSAAKGKRAKKSKGKGGYKSGDTIEFDL
jgi:topoisomerase-4 subunit A